MENYFQSLKKRLPNLKENILLAQYSTFRIGGSAKYFYTAKNKKDIIKAVQAAKNSNLPFFILGSGSNILFSDKEFPGIVIKIESSDFKITKNKIISDAGIQLSKILLISADKGLTGLEWAAGIPGTIGGAIVGNAGSKKEWVGNFVEHIETFNAITGETKIFSKKDCNFSYRNSIFKKNKNFIVLSASIALKRGNKKEIKKRIIEILQYKKETQPLGYPSAGSVFKNPEKAPAGQLIEECGLKGKKIGDAQISTKHANFIINKGNASAKDVKNLINSIKQEIKNKFGIVFEEEIQIID